MTPSPLFGVIVRWPRRLMASRRVSVSYDANGNLLTTGVMTNTWDSANRLIATLKQTVTLVNHYDGLGNRIGRTQGGVRVDYVLDVAIGLPEVLYTSEGHKYLHLPGLILTENDTGEVRYLLSDGLGSVRHAVDAAGVVVAYREYSPYGEPVIGDESSYGFTGEWFEADIGLLHLRARWYSPEHGVFLSRDVIEGEPAYQYVGGNPVNWVDPSGYQGCIPIPEYGITCSEIDYFTQDNGPMLRRTSRILVIVDCSSDCAEERPTVQPLIQRGTQGINLVALPIAIGGETKRYVDGIEAWRLSTNGLHNGRIVRHRYHTPPKIELLPRATMQEVPTNVARVSTRLSYGLPVGVGILNAREIQLRNSYGELTPRQAWEQQGANVGFTVANSFGSGYLVPAGAAPLATFFAEGSAMAVAVPVTVATIGGVCLAYDLAVAQGTVNYMIEGESFGTALIKSRNDQTKMFSFGYLE